MAQDKEFRQEYRKQKIALDQKYVMGILNLTPDSFFDGGKYVAEKSALERTEQMISEGAHLIDIGAVSTRPGSVSPALEEEWSRLRNILPSIRKEFPKTLLSVDTFRSEIAMRAVDSGADVINDISGGTLDKEMFAMAGRLKVPYVLMHMKGTPLTMQQAPKYTDVVEELMEYFTENLKQLKDHGVEEVIIDPGFGFGKTLEHNLEILDKLHEFKKFGSCILVGISRKSMVTKYFGVTKENALEGTIELNRRALLNGANILRVHDVKEAVALLQDHI